MNREFSRSQTLLVEDPHGLLTRICLGVSGLIVIAALGVLAGWRFDVVWLKSVSPTFITMKPNTALGFILLGSALLFFFSNRASARFQRLTSLTATLVVILGVVSLTQEMFGFSLGIDQWLFRETQDPIGALTPGRMVPITAINFIISGIILLSSPNHRAHVWQQGLSAWVSSTGLIVFLGYVYGGSWQTGIGIYFQMAFHTSLLFILLGACLGMLHPASGFMHLLFSHSLGSWLLWRTLPLLLLILVTLGGFSLWGEHAAFFEKAFGMALLIVGLAGILSVLVYRTAVELDRQEQEQLRAQTEIREARDQFELIFNTSPDGTLISRLDGTIVKVNDWFCQLIGYGREEVLGRSTTELNIWHNPKDREKIVALLSRQGHCENIESLYRRKDGSLLSGLLSGKLITFQGAPHIFSITRDITDRRKTERHALWIAEIQLQLLQLSRLEDAYPLIGEKILELMGSGYVIVTLPDQTRRSARIMHMAGFSGHSETLLDTLGFDVRQTAFQLNDIPDTMLQALHSPRLKRWENGLYELLMGKASREACLRAEERLQFTSIHTLGFTLHDQDYGGVIIFAQHDLASLAPALDQFVGQAAITLHRLWMERELRLRNVILSTQQAAAIDGILVVNERNEIISSNRRFLEMWEIPADLMEARDDRRLLAYVTRQIANPEEFRAQVEALYAARSQTLQDEIRLADGRIFERYSAPLQDEEGQYYGRIWYFHDITQQRTLHEQLFQAQKMESIGRLASGIAHEINTPTQYVGDNVQFLKDSCQAVLTLLAAYSESFQAYRTTAWPADAVARLDQKILAADFDYFKDEIPKAFGQTLEGVERISTIVRAMKEFAHPGKAEMTLVDLNHAIESTLIVARNEWKYVAELNLDLDTSLPMVPCLLNEFNQVILNLVVNAAHAIGDVLEKRGPDAPNSLGSLRVSTRRRESMVEIRISDTGTGIPEEIRDKIFEPFFTTKPVGKGTGQGLTISRNVIVDKLHGRIDVESKVGEGTTFVLQLPLTAEPRPTDA